METEQQSNLTREFENARKEDSGEKRMKDVE